MLGPPPPLPPKPKVLVVGVLPPPLPAPGTYLSKLRAGHEVEDKLAEWFVSRGYVVVVLNLVPETTRKGPQLISPSGLITLPDLLTFKNGKATFVEVKSKAACILFRRTGEWKTGLDLCHWNSYKRVQEKSRIPVHVYFWQKPGNLAKDTPPNRVSPNGLYWGTVDEMRETMQPGDRFSAGEHMAYWSISALHKVNDFQFEPQANANDDSEKGAT